MEPSSVGNSKSPVHLKTKSCQAVHLEVEGELVAAGCHKHQVSVKVAAPSKKAKRNRKKQKTPPEVPPPIMNEKNPSSSFILCNVLSLSVLLIPRKQKRQASSPELYDFQYTWGAHADLMT
jgi:hypothetical protein